MLQRAMALCFLLLFPAMGECQSPTLPGDGTRYFVAVYSWQEKPPIVSEAHTWATVIRVTPKADGVSIERHTISWLPAKVEIQVFSPRPEPGRNFTLEETLAIAANRPKPVRVSIWGPYEIRERTFNAFVNRKAILESGVYRYRAIDSFIRESQNVNCIHAITDMDPAFDRAHYPLFRFGDRASAYVVDQMRMRDIILNRDRTHDEWLPYFTLNQSMTRREPPPPIAYPIADIRHTIRSRFRR